MDQFLSGDDFFVEEDEATEEVVVDLLVPESLPDLRTEIGRSQPPS